MGIALELPLSAALLFFAAPTLALCAAIYALARLSKKRKALSRDLVELHERFAPVVAADAELKAVRIEIENVVRSREAEIENRLNDSSQRLEDVNANIQRQTAALAELSSSYAAKKKLYDSLDHEIKALENKLDLAELGLYEPQYLLENSAQYNDALEKNHAAQKQMIAAGTACVCTTKWTVDGSERAGRKMANQAIRMALRAFNNECEVAVSRVSWKNYDRMVAKISKSFEAINKLNESNKTQLEESFLNLKLMELRLAHEEKMRRKEEADELREQRARERDEAQAERELAAQLKKTEDEENRRRDALDRARAELSTAAATQRTALEAKISELEEKLRAATEEHERAISMAQQTKAGFVYIISNIGAFGDGIFKVGMTRRLEPQERVSELGDASVPFPFDIHALVYTKDAPGLERTLHASLSEYRVNKVNARKEFFKVPPHLLMEALKKNVPDAQFVEVPDAQEFYMSLAPQEKIQVKEKAHAEAAFPDSI